MMAATDNPTSNSGPQSDIQKLKEKLAIFDKEIEALQTKVRTLKSDNDKCQEDIDTFMKDKEDYIQYLEVKKGERQEVLSVIKLDYEKAHSIFLESKKLMDSRHSQHMEGINRQIQLVEDRIEGSRNELTQLEPIKKIRDQQLSEIARLEKELYDTNQKHLEAIQGQQRKLNAERIEISKNAESMLAQVKQEADTKAYAYVTRYITHLERENKKMDNLLLQYTQASERQLALKEMLEKQHIELMREKSLKSDIIDIHLRKIGNK